MHLDASGDKLQIVLAGAKTSADCPWVVAYADIDNSVSPAKQSAGELDGTTNGTTVVDMLTGPAASHTFAIADCQIHNQDTGAVAITVLYYNGATARPVCDVTLAVGCMLGYERGSGWYVNDGQGRRLWAQAGGYSQVGVPTLLTSASGTYTSSPGTRAYLVECQGGGGGGGGTTTTTSNGACGGGGCGGGTSWKFIVGAAAAVPYTCGAAGTAGTNGGGNGGLGGDTTFNTNVVVAKGGPGGAGQLLGTTTAFAAGGSAQSGGVGDMAAGGQAGGDGIRTSGTVGYSGNGGSSQMGTGGAAKTAAGAGTAGTGYGAGGAGGLVLNGSTAVAGGVGTAGCILITEYY